MTISTAKAKQAMQEYRRGLQSGVAQFIGVPKERIQIPESWAKRWLKAWSSAFLKSSSPEDAFQAGKIRGTVLARRRPDILMRIRMLSRR